MSVKKLRETRRASKQRRKMISTLVWSGAAVAFLAVFALIIWQEVKPPAGEAVPVMANATDHVAEGENPGLFNSDPPTSGPHYASQYDAGFYDESSPEAQAPYPEGYLGHNLEHGYVIYWYNCEQVGEGECETLKNQIQESMADNGGAKLIAFPRASIDMPVVLTSWGQMLRMDDFDANQARRFVSTNRNRAPEPDAP